MTTTIDRAGRVVIPKDMRDRNGLTPGCTVNIREQDGRIEIEPEFMEADLVPGPHGLLFIQPRHPVPPRTVEDVRATIERQRQERMDKISGPWER